MVTMTNLFIPLRIERGRLSRTQDSKLAIEQSLDLLLHTATVSFVADPHYGFVFTGLRFEIFNEHEGTVYSDREERDPIYQKKISGSSKNLQTFAAELNEAIKRYEPRLTRTAAVMTYLREQRQILVAIRGVIVQTGKPYEYRTVIKVWN